ncbi:lysylphosphatidylglycerol synthase transmembrane domain-containing protein [Geminicoccus roseus]|uniref:lysylphosphatidylglycerol synthase transmembrane domain-containing protein n=1 Tax=Geminicoccus roseus TaxID=404900 RepID=UPI0012F82658|nr:lysylphosphatidylglycerol synthase transmembrane domain-containing protein [Geminicoccus roseus]
MAKSQVSDAPLPGPAGSQAPAKGGLKALAGHVLRWLRIPLSLAVLAYLLYLVEPAQALAVLANADPWLVLLVAGMAVVDRMLAAFRWYMLLRGKHVDVAFWPVARLTFVSNFIGSFLPAGVGIEAVRVYGLSRRTADLALALSSVIVERVLALGALVLLVVLGLLVSDAGFPVWISRLAWVGLAAILLGSLALMLGPTRRLSLLLLPGQLLAPVRAKLLELYQRLDEYRAQPLMLAGAVAMALAFQLFRVATYVVAGAAIGIDASFHTYMVVVPIVSLVMMVPISFGGLGVGEAAFISLLGLVGIPAEQSFTLSIMVLVLSLVGTLPGGWFYLRGGVAPGRR